MLSAFALLAEGCHRETPRAYRQPPPPAASTNTSYPRQPEPSSNRNPETAEREPVPPPIFSGKPISSEVGTGELVWAALRRAQGSRRHRLRPECDDRRAPDAAAGNAGPCHQSHDATSLPSSASPTVGPLFEGASSTSRWPRPRPLASIAPGVARVRVEAFASANPACAGRWCVQVGAFSREKDAIKLKEQLSRRYTTAKVIEFAGPTGHWVRVNPLRPNRAHATQVAESIRTPDPTRCLTLSEPTRTCLLA